MKRKQQPSPLRSQNSGKRLRKQPKMRRMQTAHTVSGAKLQVPRTARRRRRRNNRPVQLPTAAIKQFIFSARWISLILLAMTVYALYLVGMDVNFYLTTVPVEGVNSIPPSEIVAASGLGGNHVFSVNPSEAAGRINEVPGVISATVTLRWPNEVLIQVAEDTPIAIWQEGGVDYWVTEDGRILPSRGMAAGLLRIVSEWKPSPEAVLEKAEDAKETAVAQPNIRFIAQDVLDGALLLRQLRPNIEQLYYAPAEGLSYQDGRGWRAYFGVGADMSQKLVVYEAIIQNLLAQELTPTYVSVSNQEKPYFLAQ